MKLSKKESQKQLGYELARSICNNMLRHGAALSVEFVSMSCRYVSALCRSYQKCAIAATTSAKPAKALVQENEKEYLELCGQSCNRCTLSKKAREEWKKAVEKTGLICREKQSEVYT